MSKDVACIAIDLIPTACRQSCLSEFVWPYVSTHRLLSSSGLPYRTLNINSKKELLRSLRVVEGLS